MRFTVILAIIFLSVCAAAQGTPDVARDTVKGPGYIVKLPADVEVDLSPNTELTFGINLDQPTHGHEWTRVPFRFIGFSTRWDTADSLDAVVRRMTDNVLSLVPTEITGAGEVRVASTFAARLGELPAKRLVVEFTNSKRKPSIRQIVVAYRARGDASPMVYIAALTTTRADFDHDLSLFAKLLAGFKLTPVE